MQMVKMEMSDRMENKHSQQLNNQLAVNAEELSKLIGLSTDTIYTLKSQGRIPYIKIGRRVLFPVEGIKKWLDENTTTATERW